MLIDVGLVREAERILDDLKNSRDREQRRISGWQSEMLSLRDTVATMVVTLQPGKEPRLSPDSGFEAQREQV